MQREAAKGAGKACTFGGNEMYKDNSQMRIEDFVFPYGELDRENDWVKLAVLVPWDTAEGWCHIIVEASKHLPKKKILIKVPITAI